MKKVIGVRFDQNGCLSEKEYIYFTDIEDLKVGDWVIVVVSEIPKCACITSTSGLSKADIAKASKWVASKVDLTDYNLKIQRQALISEIENELDAELQRVQRYEVFKMCAKSSPVMRELLGKLQELDPSVQLIDIAAGEVSNNG